MHESDELHQTFFIIFFIYCPKQFLKILSKNFPLFIPLHKSLRSEISLCYSCTYKKNIKLWTRKTPIKKHRNKKSSRKKKHKIRLIHFSTLSSTRAPHSREGRLGWIRKKNFLYSRHQRPKWEIHLLARSPIASENSHQTWPHFSVFSCVCSVAATLNNETKKTATKQQQFMRLATTLFIMIGSTENVGEWDETEIQFDHGLTSVQCAVFLCCCHSTVSFTTRFQLHITCMHFPLSRVSMRC